MDIPLLGSIFSTNTQDTFRTELIITVTPRVIEDPREMQKVTEELRSRMAKAGELAQSTGKPGGP